MNISFKPSVKYGFDLHETHLCKYKDILIMPNVLISNRKSADKWFLTKSNEIVEMQYVFVSNDEYFIRGTVIEDKADFFTYPFKSCYLNIFESKMQKSNEAKNFKIISFKAKLMCLSTNMSTYVFIPLIHSLTEK